MVAKIQNLRIMRGDTTRIGITIKGLDGVPEALSFSCKQSPAFTSYTFQKTLDDGIDVEQSEEGQRYIVTISPEDTQRRASGTYRYDFEAIINGDIITLLYGNLDIVADVTQHLEVSG